ncbi:MAG: primosomal protein N' [SAR202 cluster bacterium]|nr:primosomal protein N' [SAR202 cluster bacterium]
MTFAEVAVDVPGDRARTFTYSIPAGLAISPGHVVWVPFGKQTLRGVVFNVVDTSPVERTRDIDRLIHESPLLSGPQLTTSSWIASYYRVGLYHAASLMLPAGLAEVVRTYVSATGRPMPEGLGARERRALEQVVEAGRLRRDILGRRLGRGGLDVVDRLVRRKLLAASSEWEPPSIRHRFVNFLRLAVSPEEAEASATATRGRRLSDLLNALAANPDGAEKANMARAFGASAVASALARGLARVERVQVERDPLEGLVIQQTFPPAPSPAQKAAIDAIAAELRAAPQAGGRRFLLMGVTGSGKTEVYLRAAEACIATGRQVILLVPEIALTPQNLRRFAERFPGKIALLHSGLTAGERFDQWWRVQRGEYPIVLGSRGAIFAPLPALGLVLIDEEHEWTYKQHDASPRYHARAVAEVLCASAGAVLVAGSATPDVETYRRASRGDYRLLELPDRIGGLPGSPPASRADVEIIDMRDELRHGNASMFSRALHRGIDGTLRAGGRVILFLNRRGNAGFIQCRRCGSSLKCRRCSTTLAAHAVPRKEDGGVRLVCHYCNLQTRYRTDCPVCGSSALVPFAPGTQAVVEEVNRRFPRAGVLRWDRDSARTAREHTALLERFIAGPEHVLVGTQMVAKGLDIHSVTLVGVVSADTGLSIPDFRAGERAFQVLTQVAGRAGRGRAGRVIIQTFQPEHYAVQAASDQDFSAFYATEIRLRSDFDNPPFSRLVLLEYADADPLKAVREAERFARVLRRAGDTSGEATAQVIGPTPGYPLRLRGLTRWHLILKGDAPTRLLDLAALPRGWSVDVDPVSVS